MILIITLLLIVASAECRQMCYSCQYTVTSTKVGIECADHFNISAKMYKCKLSCVMQSISYTETEEISSFFRGCGAPALKDGCTELSGRLTCYHTCNKDLCNTMGIQELIDKYVKKKNTSHVISGKNSMLFIGALLLNCVNALKLF